MKEQVNELLELKLEQEFIIRRNEKYKFEVIKNSAIYIKVVKSQLPGINNLVFWNNYSDNDGI